MQKIIIPYFPSALKYSVVPIAIVGGMALAFFGSPWWLILSGLISILVLTTRYVTEISVEKKVYRDYLELVGVAFQEEIYKFNRIDKIVIVKERHQQQLNSQIQTRQFNWTTFTAQIVFDGKRTLDLITKTDKRELVLGLKDFAAFLKVHVEDQTSGHGYVIDFRNVT